jgi:IS5 family transposase
VVDEGKQLMVATALGSNAGDNGYLVELLDELKANTGVKPKRVLADAGYKGEKNFEEFEKRKIRGYVALGRESKKGGEATARMRKRLKEERGRRRYRRRKALVEAAFGWVKRVTGFREFSMRGREKAQGEWNLVTPALNLRRMARMDLQPQAT